MKKRGIKNLKNERGGKIPRSARWKIRRGNNNFNNIIVATLLGEVVLAPLLVTGGLINGPRVTLLADANGVAPHVLTSRLHNGQYGSKPATVACCMCAHQTTEARADSLLGVGKYTFPTFAGWEECVDLRAQRHMHTSHRIQLYSCRDKATRCIQLHVIGTQLCS